MPKIYSANSVNGVVADSVGAITLNVGVISITGVLVNNTDPINPVINIPSLQQVTSVSAVTTNILTTPGITSADNKYLLVTNSGMGKLYLYNSSNFSTLIIPSPTATNGTLTFPNATGILALSVNGVTPDAAGNIIISTTTSWSSIIGTLSSQLDLQSALSSKQSIISLTTTGTSGAATFISNVLNIPQYTGIITKDSYTVDGTGNLTYVVSAGYLLEKIVIIPTSDCNPYCNFTAGSPGDIIPQDTINNTTPAKGVVWGVDILGVSNTSITLSSMAVGSSVYIIKVKVV